jgi:hypothetical protein
MRNINIPACFDVSSRGQAFTVDTSKLSDEILAQAIVHGLTQTIGDAASAAAASAYEGKEPNGTPWKDLSPQRKKDWSLTHALLIAEESAALMEKRIAALYEGDWQTRKAAAAGLSKFDSYRGELVADKMEFPKGTAKAERVRAGLAKFENLASDTQAKVDKLVQARIDREREEASLAIDLSF